MQYDYLIIFPVYKEGRKVCTGIVGGMDVMEGLLIMVA